MKTTQNEVQEIEKLEVETLQAILKGQKEKVIKLFKKVEQKFILGNVYKRSIISSQFIAPLSKLLEMNYSWGKEYLDLFPVQIRTEYRRQLYTSGI